MLLQDKVAVIYGAGGPSAAPSPAPSPPRQVALPIAAYTRSYFGTARLAARRMLPNRSGVIMTVTAIASRTGTPLQGGYPPARRPRRPLGSWHRTAAWALQLLGARRGRPTLG